MHMNEAISCGVGPQLLVALGLDPDLVLWLNFAGAPIGLAGVLVAMWLTDKCVSSCVMLGSVVVDSCVLPQSGCLRLVKRD